METLFRLLPGPQPLITRFGVTFLIVAGAFLIRLNIGEGTGRFGFIHFVLPVVASSLLYDRAAGFFAVILSAVGVGLLIPWTANIDANISALVVFLVVGSCLVFVSAGLRTALIKAHAAQRAADLLLQEMSHRVKNKFTMITSIIALQSKSASPETRIALQDVSARVRIIATVHDYLQLSRHDGLIDMSEYLPGLCNALREALCGPRPIAMTSRTIPAQLPAEKALTVGLIVNELVTNAFKYAFPDDRPGRVEVALSQGQDGFIITVTDNGVGLPTDHKSGLGTRLVTVFAGQLGGSATWEAGNEAGAKVQVQFPA